MVVHSAPRSSRTPSLHLHSYPCSTAIKTGSRHNPTTRSLPQRDAHRIYPTDTTHRQSSTASFLRTLILYRTLLPAYLKRALMAHGLCKFPTELSQPSTYQCRNLVLRIRVLNADMLLAYLSLTVHLYKRRPHSNCLRRRSTDSMHSLATTPMKGPALRLRTSQPKMI